MRPDDFRQLALRLPDAIESGHQNHPDFRVGGRIFATLGYPDNEWGVVKLTPDEQRRFVRADPEIFEPVTGAWGRRGNTKVYLPNATITKVREVLAAAWRNTAPKRLIVAKGAASL
ncbi:MAG: hypothetical protein QOG67_3488 [Verrucomicrobiota bacterium]|jgi:hypothetical protein